MFIVNYFNCDSDSENLSDTKSSEDLSTDNELPDNNLKPIKRSISHNSFFFKNEDLINKVGIVDEYDLLKKINVNTKDNKMKLDNLINNFNKFDNHNRIQFNNLNNKINQLDKKVSIYDKNNIKCIIGLAGGLLFSVVLLKFMSK